MRCSILAIIAILSSTSAWSGVEVGWIEDISGNAADVDVVRNGKKIDAVRFLPIQNGDRVSVANNSPTKVTVSFGNGRNSDTIDKSHALTVKQTGEVPSVATNLMAWVVSLGKKEPQDQRVVMASTRTSSDSSNKLNIPLLPDEATLIAGKRPLALAWQGGKPPYEVTLVRRDTREVSARFSELNTTQIIKDVSLSPGVYELVVRDSASAAWREKVLAVEGGAIPEPPAELRALPENARRLLSASWLAGVEEGKWALEAYTQIALLANRNGAEENFLRALEAGQLPEVK